MEWWLFMAHHPTPHVTADHDRCRCFMGWRFPFYCHGKHENVSFLQLTHENVNISFHGSYGINEILHLLMKLQWAS